MKANAPEKIYLQEPTKVRTEKKYDNYVEYTRTDYAEKEFLIKAKMFLSEIHRVCDITDESPMGKKKRRIDEALKRRVS